MGTNTIAPRTVRAKQAAALYGVGESTLWLMAQQGKITPLKVSTRVTLWSVAELDQLFGALRPRTAPGAEGA